MDGMNAFAKEQLRRKQYAVGYPINQNIDMKDYYQWFVDSGLSVNTGRAASLKTGHGGKAPPWPESDEWGETPGMRRRS